MNVSGAEIIVDFLEQAGVRMVAGIPGGALLPLYDALGRSSRITHILTRHEQAAGFVAQGLARVSGRAGVCFATSGPGATNMVTALADAKLDSVPLVCITGQVPTHLIGTDAFQEVPTIEIVRPVTKASYFVNSAEQLAATLALAFRTAQCGRPGPVVIDVPKDVQLQRIARAACVSNPAPRDTADVAHVCTTAYERAHRMIVTARRPLLYFGGGIIRAQAHAAARRYAEEMKIPVVSSLMGLGILPREHPLNFGMLGMHGEVATNAAVAACDLLIAVGARFDDRATGDPKTFAADAKIIHIDIDARELGKIKEPTLGIVAHAAQALAHLSRQAEGSVCGAGQRAQWRERLAQLRRTRPLLTPGIERTCSPYGIMRELGKWLPHNAIVTTDVGQHQMWAAQALAIRRPDGWLTSGGLGTMGFGLPAAIGAALADGDPPVCCISGDASLAMNVQELATLAEWDLNVKIILLDNACLGMVRQQQELFYDQRRVASSFPRKTNFAAVARAYGIRAVDLKGVRDPADDLARTLAVRGPALISVPIDEHEHVLPIVPGGVCNTRAIDHVREAPKNEYNRALTIIGQHS